MPRSDRLGLFGMEELAMNREIKTTYRSTISSMCKLTMAACFGALACTGSTARADIGLELRPIQDRVPPGQTIEIGLYAVSDNLPPIQPLSATVVLLTWDPSYLMLTGHNTIGAAPMSSGSGFPKNDRSHMNEADPPQDGNALFQGLGMLGETLEATASGTLLATIEFEALRTTTGTNVEILEYAGNPVTQTIVYDGRIPNTNATGTFARHPCICDGLQSHNRL